MAGERAQVRRGAQRDGHHRLVRRGRARDERAALRGLQDARRPRRAERARVLDHLPATHDAGAGRQGARGNRAANFVSGKRLFRQHRLGRIGVHARHDQSPALRLRGEAGRHARSAPHCARPRRRRDVPEVEPIKGLRWALSHLDQVTDAQLARMKRLGLYAGLHSRPLIQGALMHKVHGERAWDMPPFRRVQDSGIVWGLGSDATAVTTSNPFYTLWFAVTGKMIGGRQVNRQTITREEALIAHTRSNAHFVFQESNLGSIQPGKYADLLVLDRDYLKVPVEQIKDIKPVMTMVGGKIVHQTKGL
ncbi:MAG: hypothetical protein E6H75_09225 [Betaproteobacteria bacterium]|nr:MAG: hypothetical protein E6H75_09225 [Betaproteobacteria bacterium]